MSRNQYLPFLHVLFLAILTSLVVIIASNPRGSAPRAPSPYHGPIYKRQDLNSQLIGRPPSSSSSTPPEAVTTTITTTTTTTSTSSPPSNPETSSTSSSVSLTTATTTVNAATRTTSASTTTTSATPTTTSSRASTSSSTSSTSTGATPSTDRTTTSANTNIVVKTRTDVTRGTTASLVSTYRITQSTVDATQTASGDSDGSKAPNKSFMENKGAVGAMFTVVGLVGASLIIFSVLFIRKKLRDRQLHKDDWDDMNDSASMAEFVSASGSRGGDGGTPVMLPSAALARQASSRGHGGDQNWMGHDRPDSMLSMPPVVNYDRAHVIPAPPPMLRTPGNHTSFDSMMGGDPFAGGSIMAWQDAQHDSAHGHGQAGRDAGMMQAPIGGNSGGYNMQPYSSGVGVAIGGDEDAYGGTTPGDQYTPGNQYAPAHQYAYPSPPHVYGRQYTNAPHQGGYMY